ncbi:MAG: HAD family hydrolase [Pseudomonadota bacterium]
MKRIAMWSGPRNLSTAMMYAFGNRADTSAMDEPFYAAFLKHSGVQHPMHQEIRSKCNADPTKVAAACANPNAGKPISYQKHMCHHMLPEFPLDWARHCTNVFLIRHPSRVVASYAKKYPPEFRDLGFERQVELFRELNGQIVIDSADIRANPKPMLEKLCAKLEIPFDPAMLTWPAGPKVFDGIWASHWYGEVHRSSGFAGPEGPLPDLPVELASLYEKAMPYYEEMKALAISP